MLVVIKIEHSDYLLTCNIEKYVNFINKISEADRVKVVLVKST